MERVIKRVFNSVEEYLEDLPKLKKERLNHIRDLVKQNVPEANEVISYNMPAYKYHGILIYMAAHKNHIGFYPGSTSAIRHFKNQLGNLITSKGTIQIQDAEKLPKAVIKKIILFRAKENIDRFKAKGI